MLDYIALNDRLFDFKIRFGGRGMLERHDEDADCPARLVNRTFHGVVMPGYIKNLGFGGRFDVFAGEGVICPSLCGGTAHQRRGDYC